MHRLLRFGSRLRRNVRDLSLGAKFTLLLSLILAVAVVVVTVALYHVLLRRAAAAVTAEGLALLDTMNAVRQYTAENVSPLLELHPPPAIFVPETVPAFSARKVFDYLTEQAEEERFYYKEATPDARYPGNLADEFERGLLEQFRQDPELAEISGFRTVAGERLFYTSRPLAITGMGCLRCHTTPETAPASMVAAYGAQAAFSYELGDVVAAQTLYVPAGEVLGAAELSLALVMVIFLAAFCSSVVLINYLLRCLVVQPVGRMARLARLIGADRMDSAEFEPDSLAQDVKRRDELGQLAQVFARMAQEVRAREQQLRSELSQLRIQVDERHRQRDVAEITESDFFQQVQKKVRRLRDEAQDPKQEDAGPSS